MNLFTKHPESIGETYLEHLYFALRTGFKLMLGGMACMIHGIFPFMFQTTGSTVAKKMLADVERRKQGHTN